MAMWQRVFELYPTPPFRLDYTAWALKRREANILDQVGGGTYRRVDVFGGEPLLVEAVEVGRVEEPRLVVRVYAEHGVEGAEEEVAERLERVLSLKLDLSGFYRTAEGDPHLSELASAFLGLKPPRFPTLFEALVNAVACQQVSLDVGLTLISRLAQKLGSRIDVGGTAYSFPQPERIAGASAADIRLLGFSRRKAEVILDLASAFLRGELDESRLEKMGNEQAVGVLDAIKGIGRWSAEYVLLRGLGRLDVYPVDDVGAARSLAEWLGAHRTFSRAEVESVTSKWGRYRGMVYFLLLLRGLKKMGVFR